MQKIVPHLWFDKEAKEATAFYTSLFPNSRVTNITTLHDTPSGDADTVAFELNGQEFMAISAGPYFKLNPSISLLVNFDPSQDPNAQEHLDKVWDALSEGGTALMPLQEYPFSKRYGWIQDKYGFSWQLMLTNPDGEPRPLFTPFLLFVKERAGLAEKAIAFYLSVFKNAKRGNTVRFPAGMEPEKEGTIMFADFQLENQWFAAMDSAQDHKFDFNEAVSFIVKCDSQEEIDYFWAQLSSVPEAEQCGWLKDQFGVSWQITPRKLDDMMRTGTLEQVNRVTQAFLPMKKMDLAALEKAFEG